VLDGGDEIIGARLETLLQNAEEQYTQVEVWTFKDTRQHGFAGIGAAGRVVGWDIFLISYGVRMKTGISTCKPTGRSGS
jgi:hypothetical protein